jgi:hypothetical protein
VRARVLGLVGCLLLLAPAATGAAPRTCPTLADRRGDQQPAGDPAADLVRVDLASDSRSVTVVVERGGEQPQATPVAGHTYAVLLDTLEGAVSLRVDVRGAETSFTLYRHDSVGSDAGSVSGGTAVGPVRGRVDARRHTLHALVPYAMAPDLLSRGTSLRVTASASTSLLTPSLPVVGTAFVTQTSDESDRPGRHDLGKPGCVPLER